MKKLLIILAVFILALPLFSTDWYVRPEGGVYGAEDGTSYADAWDGLSSVVWGVGGVVAGDTLYVCGCHIRDYTAHPPGSQTWTIGASGTVGNVITIRGDSGSEAGEIWGAALFDVAAWDAEGDNTYSQSLTKAISSAWIFEDVALGSHTVLTKQSSLADCKSNAGSYYSATYGVGTDLYVHCSDNGDPTGRIAVNRMGWNILIHQRSYITFEGMDTYCIYRWLDYTLTPAHWAANMTWNNSNLWYGEFAIIFFRDDSPYFTFDNCDIRWAKNGICVSPRDAPPASTHNWTIKNCLIRDIGVRETDSDAHAVSVQNTYNALVENNEMTNCGSTVCFYLSTNEEVKNNIIRKNYIHDSHTLGGSPGNGICMTLGASQGIGTGTGNKIYENIVARCENGIRTQYHDEVEIYNNVSMDSTTDNYLINRWDFQIRAVLRNNISFFTSWSAGKHHIYYRTGALEGNDYIDSDYNDFYPIDSEDCFRYDDTLGAAVELTFVEWKAKVRTDCVWDPSSITTDPAFVNAGGSYLLDTDFQIPTDSPCKDAGVNVGIGTCYFEVTIPSGVAPDIGVHEYDQGDSGNEGTLKPGSKIIILPGGKVIIKEPKVRRNLWN